MSATEPVRHSPLSSSVVPDRSEIVVVPASDLDASSADSLDGEMRELPRLGFDRVVIDLRGVGFVDSMGLRVLLSLRNDAKRDGHSLVLIPGSPAVQRVFALTATRTLFDWRED